MIQKLAEEKQGSSDFSTALLAAALAYADRGFAPIPVKGKRAAVDWKQYQARRPDEQTLRRLFSSENVTGLALITGAVSGGLAVRDFDQADAYAVWAGQNRADAAILPTVQTYRGFHVWGRLDAEEYIDFGGGDGELRADRGHYIVCPPSIHPSGTQYQWINQLSDTLPLLPQSLLKTTQANTSIHTACVPTGIENLIAQTLPTGPGQRHKCVWRLARGIKALMPDAKRADLRRIVEKWHGLALAVVRTKDFSTTWTDFVTAWQNVKYPAGVAFWAAVQASEDIALKGLAASYDADLRKLAKLCAALQAQSPGGTFFLGCREAEAIGISRMKACRLFRVLQFDGVLLLVTKGSKASGKSSEWLFRCPDADS
jgi:hypothetical protein